MSVAKDPLCPAEPLSRGQRNWPLSDSYNRFGLCDSLRPLRQRSIGQSGPFARSIERGYLRAHACCLAVLARGELAAAKFALARDGVAGAGYSASAGTRAS